MSPSARTVLPLAALSAGTWIGVGRPWLGQLAAIAAGTWIGLARPTATAVAAMTPRPLSPARLTSAGPPPAPSIAKNDPAPHPPAEPASPVSQLNPEDDLDRAWLLAEGPYHPPRDGRRLVTFTFDDGPSPETAPTLLRILEAHQIRAAFFFIGEYLVGPDRRAEESREWALRIAEAGHYVGNHTLDHKRMSGLPRPAALAEIDDAQAAIEQATGVRPSLFRPPYGQLDPWMQAALRDRHLDLLLWSVDVEDLRRRDPDETARCIEEQLVNKRGGIVLLHDMHWPSIRAFNRLLRRLEAKRWHPERPDQQGWDIVDLPEYLRATAASPQPYATNDELQRARRHPRVDARATEL